MSTVLPVKLDGIHVVDVIDEPRLQVALDVGGRRKRKIVVRYSKRDTSERVRQVLALRLAVIRRCRCRKSREVGLHPCMDGEALGILSYSLPVGRSIVRIGVASIVDDVRDTV